MGGPVRTHSSEVAIEATVFLAMKMMWLMLCKPLFWVPTNPRQPLNRAIKAMNGMNDRVGALAPLSSNRCIYLALEHCMMNLRWLRRAKHWPGLHGIASSRTYRAQAQ